LVSGLLRLVKANLLRPPSESRSMLDNSSIQKTENFGKSGVISSRQLGFRLLEEFSAMLMEGVFVEAGESLRDLIPCQLLIARSRSRLELLSLSKNSECTSSSTEPELPFRLSIPLVTVVDVRLHYVSSQVVCVKYLENQAKSLTNQVIESNVLDEASFTTLSTPPLLSQTKEVFLHGEDSEETDALLAGLQVLATHVRGEYVKKISRANQLLSLMQQRVALHKWMIIVANTAKNA
jgi:hypothetical protein